MNDNIDILYKKLIIHPSFIFSIFDFLFVKSATNKSNNIGLKPES